MEKHRLTVADEWFIKKGQVDSISRSHFSVGDEVVVCDRQHVMLAEFYDGECPTCHSKKLVQFNRENVEPGSLHTFVGACPKCNKNVTIIFSKHGKQPYIGKCPSCNKQISLAPDYFKNLKVLQQAERYIRTVHRVLEFMLLVAIISVILLNYKGLISNENILMYGKEVILPRTIIIVDRLKEYILSDSVGVQFKNSFIPIVGNTNILVQNALDVFMLMMVGLQSILWIICNESIRVYDNTCDLVRLIKIKTEMLIDYFDK
ncbi:MAG: hypothetical protein HDR04_13445 [Lachnospiraceae bacterium]|nr:hypothetical protein [Lachnospiraceae bacterium]